MTHKRMTLIGALAIAGAVLGGCGGGDDGDSGEGDSDGGLSTGDGGGGGDGPVTVIAEDSLSFDRDAYTARAGGVTFDYENSGNLTHTLLIDGVDDFELRVTSNGDTDEGTAQLDAGDYRIYCDIPGHESMEATLTVE